MPYELPPCIHSILLPYVAQAISKQFVLEPFGILLTYRNYTRVHRFSRNKSLPGNFENAMLSSFASKNS